MSKLEKLFKVLGFTKKQYETVVNDPQVTLTDYTLYRTFLRNAALLMKNGFKKEDIIKLVMSNHNSTYLNLDKKVEIFSTIGYDSDQFFIMLKRCSRLVSLSEDNLKKSLQDLESLGYKREDLKKMTIEYPELLSYNIARIKGKLDELHSCNYSDEEIYKITTGYPGIFGTDRAKLKPKLDYYDTIGLHDYIVGRPKDLIQSAEVTYARYQYFITRGMLIDRTAKQSLFKKEPAFKKQFGVDKQTLLSMWRFSDYLESLKIKDKVKINTNTVLG